MKLGNECTLYYILNLTSFNVTLLIINTKEEVHDSTFAELQIKDKSVSIHDRNLQIFATEIYKALNNISPAIINSIFQVKKRVKK